MHDGPQHIVKNRHLLIFVWEKILKVPTEMKVVIYSFAQVVVKQLKLYFLINMAVALPLFFRVNRRNYLRNQQHQSQPGQSQGSVPGFLNSHFQKTMMMTVTMSYQFLTSLEMQKML